MTAIHIDIDHASPPHSGRTFFDCRRARMRTKTDTGLTVISISWPDPVKWSTANESRSLVDTGGSVAGRRLIPQR